MPMRAAARLWLALAGFAGAAGVASAATAAHGGLADPALVERAALFLLLHAPALAAVAWLADRRGGVWPQLAGLGFVAGQALFCGTLLARGAGFSVPNGLAPAGGIAFIFGWLALAGSALPRGAE
ncbi:MAG: DUF423 domain-containing protein [Dongiaceae bacterium]